MRRHRYIHMPLAVSCGVLALTLAQAGSVHADPYGAHSALIAVSGQGAGEAIVAPTAALGHGNFDARVTVNIRQASPNTTFSIIRAADPVPDGTCTGTFGQVAALTTSPGGAGAVEFERTGPLLNFDLQIEAVGSDGTVLQSQCMTIIAK
jgi:hypothetical protein